MKGLQLTEVARELLTVNWPKDPMARLRLGIDLQCTPETLIRIKEGKTKNPSTDTSQRIYEHYTGKPLLADESLLSA